MKYLKTKNISKFSVADRGFIIEQPSGKITTNSQNSIKIPTGALERRPVVPDQGMIRFTTNDVANHEDVNVENYFPSRPIGIEAYFDGSWRPIRLQGPSTVTKYYAGMGNYDAILQPNEDLSRFFPSSGEPLPIVPESADNIIVLVENVFQISGDNFNLIESSGEVVAVEITNGGSNYNTPANVTVTFDDPFTGAAWAPSTSLNLSDYIYYVNGGVKNWYRVVTPGTTSSSSGPTHTSGSSLNGNVLFAYVGTTARGNVTVIGGEVTEVTIIDTGSGYTSVPAVSFNDTSGSPGADAAGTAVITKSGWHIEFLSAVPDTKKVHIYYGFDQ